MQTITSRQDLTAYVIDALQDFAGEHDVEAIVDELQERHDNDNAAAAQDEDFWGVVERHATTTRTMTDVEDMQNITARLTRINHVDETGSWDEVTVYRDGQEVDFVRVESSESPEPYDAAVRKAGYPAFTWED